MQTLIGKEALKTTDEILAGTQPLLPRGEESSADALARVAEASAEHAADQEDPRPGFLTRTAELLAQTPRGIFMVGAVSVAAVAMLKPKVFKPELGIAKATAHDIAQGFRAVVPDEHPPTFKDSP